MAQKVAGGAALAATATAMAVKTQYRADVAEKKKGNVNFNLAEEWNNGDWDRHTSTQFTDNANKQVEFYTQMKDEIDLIINQSPAPNLGELAKILQQNIGSMDAIEVRVPIAKAIAYALSKVHTLSKKNDPEAKNLSLYEKDKRLLKIKDNVRAIIDTITDSMPFNTPLDPRKILYITEPDEGQGLGSTSIAMLAQRGFATSGETIIDKHTILSLEHLGDKNKAGRLKYIQEIEEKEPAAAPQSSGPAYGK